MKIGIIAEDDSDVAVLRELTLSLLKPKNVGFKRFVGDGCGKLRRKCAAWARILVQQGCRCIVLLHDLDVYDEKELRAMLEEAILTAEAKAKVVLIPKREIEAWLLYDGTAIARAFKAAQPPHLPGNPETIADPKKHLRDLIWKKYRKEYLNTVHNAQIARYINTAMLHRSASFSPHIAFTKKVRGMIG